MTMVLLLTMVMVMAQTEAVSEILQEKYRGNNTRVEELLKTGPTLNIFEASPGSMIAMSSLSRTVYESCSSPTRRSSTSMQRMDSIR